jgi:hypothetical protein
MAEPVNNNGKPAKTNYVGRLHKAIVQWRKLNKNVNEKNNKMLNAYASGYYKPKLAEGDPHPLNMVDRAVSIWLPYLVGGYPKVVINPKINLQYSPFAAVFQMALNQLLKDMKFATRTLKPVVLNSLFGQGITKTGTKKEGTYNVNGILSDYGSPYCEIVSESSYVADVTAKDREQYEFEGDCYYLPTAQAKEQFSKHADKIIPDFKLYGDQHPKEITNPSKVLYNELHDYSEFIDLWLPKEGVIITIMPPGKGYTKILNTVEYNGPQSGPYDVLFYKQFPESTIPIPPIFSLMELDAAINTLFSKARSQAERLKKLGVGARGSQEDAETVRDAKDGDMLSLTDPASVKELTVGGVVPEIYEFIQFSLGQFSEQGGNLFTTGGRKSQAKTLGQEEMLMTNASRTLNDMSQTVHYFASNIAEKLAFELWNNPTMQIKAIKDLPGGIQIPQMYNQLQQQGKFTDYYLDVEMFSMQKLTPEQKFQKIMQMLTAWVLPTAQMAAQQGQQLNIPEITKQLSTYMDLETSSWFLTENPQQQQQMNAYQQMGMGGGVKSADTRFGSNPADNDNNRLQQINSKTQKMGGEM